MKIIDFLQLIVVLVIAFIPTYYFAQSRDADEHLKAGTGVALAGVVTVIYKTWVQRNHRD